MTTHQKRKKKHYRESDKPCVVLCSVDSSEEGVRQFYCDGEILPLTAVGTVTVCLDDESEVQLIAGNAIPQDINGFVILDKDSMKMKFIPGKIDQVEIPEVITPESVQETFCPGETMPTTFQGKVFGCLTDQTEVCLASGDLIPLDLDGVIQIDEVSGKAHFDQNSVKPPTDDYIALIAKAVAQNCIDLLPADVDTDTVRSDEEILALSKIAAQACIDANVDNVRTDAEIQVLAKQVAQSCIDLLPADQVRTDIEIQLLAKAVAEACLADLPADEVRSDEDIKTISENCFALLAADFLSASEIYSYIDSEIDGLPLSIDTDTVRPDSEIIALASQTVKECLADYDDQTRSDLEIEAIAKQSFIACMALLPPDTVRTEAEIIGISTQVVKDCIAGLEDDTRSNEEIEGIAKSVFTECIALLPASIDTVRSDLEIKALAKEVFLECADLLTVDESGDPITPRSDAEIQLLAKAVAQTCINDNPDAVRSDVEIQAIVDAAIALLPPDTDTDTVRSDEEIEALSKAVAESCISLLPGPRTDAEIISLIEQYIEDQPGDWTQTQIETISKAVAQACIDSNPDNVRSNAEIEAIAKIIAQQCIDDNGVQVRTDEEIEALAKTVAEACIALLPADVDTVRSDEDIKAIVESCLNTIPDIDTYGIPQEATEAGNDFFGKAYTVGSNIIIYPGDLIVCIDSKQQPVSVRVSGEPASILSCLAECQYVYNCETDMWFQMIDGTLVSVPTAGIPTVSYFFGDISGRSFACKYEEFGNTYCHNYVQSYLHGELCVTACIGSVSTITFPAVDTGNSTTVTFNWGDGSSNTYSDGDIPTHDYAELFSGKIEACFDKCADPAFAWASATGTFVYLDSNCGC